MRIGNANQIQVAPPSLTSTLAKAAVKEPVLMTTDIVDLGASLSLAFHTTAGAATDLMTGAGYVMGGYHAIRGVIHLLHNPMSNECAPTRSDLAKGTGELLSAVGMFSAAAGVGPVALPFLALGMLLNTAQTLAD